MLYAAVAARNGFGDYLALLDLPPAEWELVTTGVDRLLARDAAAPSSP